MENEKDPPRIPRLGFPEEMWDQDGDYVARPRKDLVVCVFGLPGDLTVNFTKYRQPREDDEDLSDVWYKNATVAEYDADDPLQAVGIILNYLDTHPQR